eukprot:TRINITY_DN15138_c0_g1_i1.p1 TRINITY_DN15138_c0_g1~~TRINITY_DN15138_c0_g1_i1.p1  ORF type:complete len:232 (-),score=35.17 TRINITY_DN15138_c0_g1_i1:292-987(-)
MLRLVLLSVAVACASAIVCMPDTCSRVRCAAVTAESCVGGTIKRNGGFCGCCDLCVTQLAEGDRCISYMPVGVPATTECQEGLICDPHTYTCQPTARQTLSCAERLQQIHAAQTNGLPLLGQFIPVCEADGTYFARQCHGSMCYCVDFKGAKITGYGANIREAANVGCKCARDQHAYMQTRRIGKMFSCTRTGNYQRYACSGSVCYCADELGAMKDGSATVNIGSLENLNC